MNNLVRRVLNVKGQVQGVGFRPFVYRLAVACGLTGLVGNETGAVRIETQGARAATAKFLRRFRRELPPLAEVASVRCRPLEIAAGETGFRIVPSAGGEMADTQVTADTVVCADCLREMTDPHDRRFGYPFTNCTNCGPRYTIVRRVPYDRPNTTMDAFALCPDCRREYGDPSDRRYHAQPIACPACGPHVWLADSQGRPMEGSDPVAQTAALLRRGRIVAIKGLGGFQLAVRADRDHAVRRLRMRKNRQAKPLALMVRDLAAAAELVELTDEAAALLTGPRGPVVLLPRRPHAPVAPSVAEGATMLGVMLPTTPLHHLLFAAGLPPLVMTSGNISEEPLVKDNQDAVAHLGRIADALLLHDRPIERRVDDSVVMLDGLGQLTPVRRARGLAPAPLRVPGTAAPPVLAVGAELKNAFCLYSSGRAILSEHIGDLKDGRAYRHFLQTIRHHEALYAFAPELIAADEHPDYLSTQYAVKRSRGELPDAPPCPLVLVQHHHAHIASVLAENGHAGPAIGIAVDGVGYGPDGAVWGCEILRADLAGYERLGHLRYFPLPGGDLAATQTVRPALSLLRESLGDHWRHRPLASRFPVEQADSLSSLLESEVNCPPASSLGRLFDAAAFLCGVGQVNSFEGQAPMALEAMAADSERAAYEFVLAEGQPFEIDFAPLIRQMADDLDAGAAPAVVSGRFHNTLAEFLTAAAGRARELTGIAVAALSGGCLANRRLLAGLVTRLRQSGFTVLTHRLVPCNDGGLALGQALVAAHRWSMQTFAQTSQSGEFLIGRPAATQDL